MVRVPVLVNLRLIEAVDGAVFIAKCLELWDQGKNTKEISAILFQPEHAVESATRLGRERRR